MPHDRVVVVDGHGDVRRTARLAPPAHRDDHRPWVLRDEGPDRLRRPGSAASGLRIVLADDQPPVRASVVRALRHLGHRVVAETEDGDAAVDAVARTRPDVAVLDIRMPPSFTDEGLRAATRIGETGDPPGVVVLSQYVEATWAIRLMDRRSPGTAYLLKDRIEDLRLLDRAVRTAATGGSFVDDEIVGRLLRRQNAGLRGLTDRERTVLALMAEGRSNAGIAEDLHLNGKTIESHVRSIFQKLGVAENGDDHRRVRAVLMYLDAPP